MTDRKQNHTDGGDFPLPEAQLDALFEAAQAVPAVLPSDDLMARIFADAEAQIDARSEELRQASAPDRAAKGLWARLLDLLGGPTPAAGLLSAAVVGLGVGLVAPSNVAALAMGEWNTAASAQVLVAQWDETWSNEDVQTGDLIDAMMPDIYTVSVEG